MEEGADHKNRGKRREGVLVGPEVTRGGEKKHHQVAGAGSQKKTCSGNGVRRWESGLCVKRERKWELKDWGGW